MEHKNNHFEGLKIAEARLYPPLADPPNEKQRNSLLRLLNKVRAKWVDGILKQSLFQNILIPLNKQFTDDAVDPPWNRSLDLSECRQQLSFNNTSIDTIFDATGLLLILGEVGSGKTITLLELTSTLISRAENDPRERIPVVLNLSSWQKSRSLFDWIVGELNTAYEVPRKMGQDWLGKGHIIPLLDDLDEVKTELQPDCVKAINDYITETKPHGMVVCGRLEQHQCLTKPLKMNGAICIQPLSPQQIDNYFSELDNEFESLRITIKENSAIQEIAQSPLMLNVMCIAYQSVDLNILIEDKKLPIEAQRIKILDAFVENAFQHKDTFNHIFPKEKVKGWLCWIAKKMKDDSQSIFLVENMQPKHLNNWIQRFTYYGISSLFFGTIIGLIVGWALGNVLIIPLTLISVSSGAGPIGALIVMEVSDISDAVISRSIMITLVIFLFARSNLSIVNGIICGLITWLIVIPFNFGWIELFGLKGYLILTLLYGLFIGLLVGITVGSLKSINFCEKTNWGWKSFFYMSLLSLLSGSLFLILPIIITENVLIEYFLLLISSSLLTSLIFNAIINSSLTIKKDENNSNRDVLSFVKKSMVVSLLVIFAWVLFVELSLLLMSRNPDLNNEIRDISAVKLMSTSFIFTLWYAWGIALIFSLTGGLNAVLKHYSLRMTLWISAKMPFRFLPFLKYCAKLNLLQKVGDGYIFANRALQEYFIRLETGNKLLKDDQSVPIN